MAITRFRSILACLLAVTCLAAAAAAGPPASRYFAIEVLDADTARGVPLAELRTVNDIRHYTDSAGLVAFDEPGLMDREVYFHVASDGYEYPADGFGNRGMRLTPTAGGKATIKLKRLNLAERLYRITGQGVYRDSVLLGRQTPLKHPVLNGGVLGQDSVMTAIYQGKVYWFWGDTSRAGYPLGHFQMAGAVSMLPSDGGLDPSKGVDLDYFVDDTGFSRPMTPLPEPGVVWASGFLTLQDDTGRERMVCYYSRRKGLAEQLEHGLMVYDDATQAFQRVLQLDDDAPLHPDGHPVRVAMQGEDYFCFAHPYPFVRVRAQWKDVFDPAAYEAFTPLEPGARYAGKETQLDRDDDGKLIWRWKRDTDQLDHQRQQELIRLGLLKPEEAWIGMKDAETGEEANAHRGSVAWNAYRGKWIMIFNLFGGRPSNLGELYYAESDSIEGPWREGRKIVTHAHYSFYNPRHHPFFDQKKGRFIYFEGTYTKMFSSAPHSTPRYDYNQIMYRLDLSDPRLNLEPAGGGKPRDGG